MSDLKRKASSEIDASEEPNTKRHQSGPDSNTMNHEQIINSAAAWNLTEEATVEDASPDGSVSVQDMPAHDAPAQVTPPQHLEVQGMPSRGAPAQVVATLNTEKREFKPRRKSVEPDSDKSARQLRIESMVDPGQNVRERGTVRNVDGDLRWVAADGTLVPCVYHNSIRAELIAEASHNGTLSYDVPRRHGNLDFNATDITAYHPEQKAWSEERSLWPRIRGNILNRLERKQYKELYAGQDPGKMMHEGRLVVDHDNHPVYMFPDLPATISSAVEGWWLEAITRLDSRIDRMDIRARLPAFRGKTDVKKESKLYGLSAIGNKRLRFREREGLIAWDSRTGSDLINQFFKSRLPAGCVERNTTEGGGSLSPGEVKRFEVLKKGKAEHADQIKGPKKAMKKSPSPENAAGSSSARDFGYDGPAPEIRGPTAAPSVPPRGQQSPNAPPVLGTPGAPTPESAPKINLDDSSNGITPADIPISRGLKPAEVLGQYSLLSNLTGQIQNDFNAAIEAINDEENAFTSIRAGNNSRKGRNGHGTRDKNESEACQPGSNVQTMTRADEHAEDAVSQPQNVQRLSDTNSSNKNIIDLTSPSPPRTQSTSVAAAPEHQPAPQQTVFHNTVGDDYWAPESEEIDEAFWEQTMNKAWSSAGDQNSDPAKLEAGSQCITHNGEEHVSPDPLFHDWASKDDLLTAQPQSQLEPIQPGSERFHFSPNPRYDPFAPEDNGSVKNQEALQVGAPQPSAGELNSSQDPLFEDLFADLVPELTPEAIQEMGKSLGPSGSFADYRSHLPEQGVFEGPEAQAETATTASKRKTRDQEPSEGKKKVRLQEIPTTYTPYQPRKDQRRVPTQHPCPQNRQRLPPHVSSSLAPLLAQGSLLTPTAIPEKPPTPGSATMMPPPRRRPSPGNQTSLSPPAPTNAKQHGSRSNTAKTPQVQPTPHNPQRHQTLPPYQSQLPRFPASHGIPPNSISTPTNTTPSRTLQRTPTQTTTSGAPIDHRYATPTRPDQMALIITLLEPTIAQFQNLMQGTPYANHVVDTDMAASYMTQYHHIVRELEMLWGQMNWDRSALPKLRVAGPIDGARWEGR